MSEAGEGQTVGRRPVSRHRRHRENGSGRKRMVGIRLDDAEYAELVAAASRVGLTPSSYAAACAMAAARNTTPPVEVPARRAIVELQEARTQVRRFAVNVNQAVAALNATGQAPEWMRTAIEGAGRAVARVEAAALEAQRTLR